MTGSIYKNGVFYGEPNMAVKYYDNPQDYYDLPESEREAMTELVILNDDDNPLDASNITYGNGSNVNDKLNTITSAISSLNSTTTWKLLGTKTGNTSISLPSDFKELHIVFSINNGGRWTTLNVLKEDLSASNRTFGCGYYAANDNLRILLKINTSSISNFEAFYTGANVVDASSYTVYYR